MIADPAPRTTWFSRWINRLGQLGAYHAAETNTRRADTGSRIRSSDHMLDDTRRRRLVEGARDVRRNYAIAAWMIRRHLDYVTSFTFQPATGDEQFDGQWLRQMARWSKRQHCDVAAKFPLQTILRMMEAGRTVAGDILCVRLASGRIQAIPGDRIRDPLYKPGEPKPDLITHGVVHDAAFRPAAYAVHSRDQWGNYAFERYVSAANAYLLGYFDDFDQVRGVSPLSAALNPLRDTYEAAEYALAKMKVSQLFGLAIYREAMGEEDPLPAAETEEEADAEEESADAGRYKVDFGKGPIKLELEPGDKAEFLEAQSPSAPFQEFSKTEIAVALKALDIPYSFYDESATNFYGSRAAAMQYERACQHKREDLRDLLAQLTAWNLVRWTIDGTLTLPAGLTITDALERYEWIHAGTPWWKPLEETNADRQAIRCAFKTHDQTTRERLGKPFRQIVDELAAEYAYARDRGVTLDTMVPEIAVPAPITSPATQPPAPPAPTEPAKP